MRNSGHTVPRKRDFARIACGTRNQNHPVAGVSLFSGLVPFPLQLFLVFVYTVLAAAQRAATRNRPMRG